MARTHLSAPRCILALATLGLALGVASVAAKLTPESKVYQVANRTAVPVALYNERWMENLLPVIGNRTIYDITLPGTHDSGAYLLYDEIDPDLDSELLQKLIEKAIELGIPVYDLMEGWALCQTRTFYEQLIGGIRSLDFRAAWDGEQWRTIHFLLGEPVQLLLDDIQRFLASHPNEIIHILIGNLGGSAPLSVERQNLLTQIEASLGRYMYPRTPDCIVRETISEMLAQGFQVMLYYPDSRDIEGRPLFWPQDGCNEGRYANANNVGDMEAHNINLIETLNGNLKLFTLSWTITPQVIDIVRGLPPNATSPRNLYDLLRPGNDRLDGFFKERYRYRLGNVLISDFFEETNLVEVAKTWNRRDCNDNPQYRARAPDAQDCRSWAEAGRCESDREFMTGACPLTCGICGDSAGEPGDACASGVECISRQCGPSGICLTDDPFPAGSSCGVDNQCISARCDQEQKRCV